MYVQVWLLKSLIEMYDVTFPESELLCPSKKRVVELCVCWDCGVSRISSKLLHPPVALSTISGSV